MAVGIRLIGRERVGKAFVGNEEVHGRTLRRFGAKRREGEGCPFSRDRVQVLIVFLGDPLRGGEAEPDAVVLAAKAYAVWGFKACSWSGELDTGAVISMAGPHPPRRRVR